jgi:hypothetical protein
MNNIERDTSIGESFEALQNGSIGETVGRALSLLR